MGNVHQIVFVTLFDLVKKKAIGKTKITSLNKEITKGLIAYLIDCKMPWMATENPINIKPVLEILKADVQTLIISVVVLPVRPNILDKG